MPLAELDLFGLGTTGSVVVVVAAALLALIWLRHWLREDFDDPGYPYSSQRVDQGVLLPEFVASDELIAIASQRGIVPNPAWVEQGQSTETGGEVGGGHGGPQRAPKPSSHVRAAGAHRHAP